MIDEASYLDTFDREMANRGGRLRGGEPALDAILTWRKTGQQIVDGFRSGLPDSMPYVHFDIIANLKMNACAFIADDKEFIGVNVGTLLILQDMFHRMLARRDTFSLVGDPDVEDEIPLVLPGITTDWQEIRQARAEEIVKGFPIPKDAEREQFAFLLVNTAFIFIVSHEVAHLRNGHVRLLNKLGGETQIVEIDSSTIIGDPLTRQVLEWDADSWAAIQSSFYALKIISVENADLLRNFNSLFEASLWLWGIAIWSVFRLFGVGRVNSKNITSLKYPPPSYRQWICVFVLYQVIERDYGVEYSEQAMKLVPNILVAAENAINSVTSEESELAIVLDSINAVSGEHTKLMNEHWSTVVRSELIALSYDPNLPP